MGFLDFLFGKPEKTEKQSLLTNEQQSALKDYFSNPIQKSSLYGAGSNYLEQLLSGSPEAYSAFEKPLVENFEQNIAPGIAERFAGMGTGAGALSSSAFNSSLAQAGRGLATDIGALRAGTQLQALPQALNYAQQPYANTLAGTGQRSFENVTRPQSHGLLGNTLAGIGGGFSEGFGTGLVNPVLNKLGLAGK